MMATRDYYSENVRLYDEIDRLRGKCNEYHRRAQAAESHAIRFADQNSNAAAWRTVAMLKKFYEAQEERADRWEAPAKKPSFMTWFTGLFR